MSRIKELAASERPRERLAAGGAASLRTAELLAILLRTGLQGKSAIAIGDELLARYDGLERLARADVRELSSIKGIGPAKAVQLKAAFELGARLARATVESQPVASPQDVERLLGAEMRLLGQESLRVILLNTRLRLIAVKELSRGSTNETVSHPRDVMEAAVLHRAYGFILAHNHPSGDPAPSSADHEFTIRLRDAARIMKVQFIDHVILGSPAPGRAASYSFKESGYL